MRALARPALAPREGAAGAEPAVAGVGGPEYLRFRLGDCGYLLPTRCLVSVLDAAALRPLPTPVPGWAGTVVLHVPARGGGAEGHVVPVLDAAALLRGETRPRSVLVLRASTGLLGLAVPAPEGLRAPPGPVAPVAGAPGLAGGVASEGEVWLALAPEYLGALRQAVIAKTPAGRVVPRPATWLAAARPGSRPTAGQRAAVGDLLLVLGERLRADPSHLLALLLRSAPDGQGSELLRARPQVAYRGPLVAGPPGASCVVGYRAWGPRVVPAVDLAALGVAPGDSSRAYAVLLGLAAPAGVRSEVSAVVGVALLVPRLQGIARLEGIVTHGGPDDPIVAHGTTSAGPVAVLSYPHLMGQLIAASGSC